MPAAKRPEPKRYPVSENKQTRIALIAVTATKRLSSFILVLPISPNFPADNDIYIPETGCYANE